MDNRDRATLNTSSGPVPTFLAKLREVATHIKNHPIPCECGSGLTARTIRTVNDHLLIGCSRCRSARSRLDQLQLRTDRSRGIRR